jgi:hydroxymethylbilane synthase
MTAPPNTLVIASRGSRLALLQAGMVADRVARARPETRVEVRATSTAGDRDARAFADIGSRGLFVAEVEREVVEGRADVAVHSAKDLTANLAEGCTILCIPPRAAVEDVVVGGRGPTGEERLGALDPGARVGTASIRRRSLIAELRPDLEVVDLRGNLDTRLTRVERGEVDAAVLAAAGIDRLGAIVERAPLDPERWVPAPAQGALAVEGLRERTDLAVLFAPLEDRRAAAEVACERAFARRLQGGCSVPLGCRARADGDRLVVTAFVGAPEGGQCLRDRISGPAGQALALGAELAEALLAEGADEILEEARAAPGAPSPP